MESEQASTSESFYRELPAFNNFSTVADTENYRAVPGDWDLIITDVLGSTKAIEAGRYKDVNAAGVASIVVVRNSVSDLDIPYVFGGDGATMLTPSSRREEVKAALRGLRVACHEAFELEMRVGIVPISLLRKEGHEIEAARFAASGQVSFAMLRGSGVDIGEDWIKDPARGKEFFVDEKGPISQDFDGFECRWQPIPSRNGIVASIIVQAQSENSAQRAIAYRKILGEISNIAQLVDEGRPVSPKQMQLKKASANFDQEANLKASGKNSEKLAEVRKRISKSVRNARLLFKTRISIGGFNPRRYKQEVVENTDFRKFDNVLRMHLDLRRGQLDQLKQILQKAEDAGHIIYGIHTADHSLMTCVIDNYQGGHAHFVDGAAGGYALAAKRLKAVRART